MKRYKLIKEYPGHKIGDIAVFDARISESNFLFLPKNETIENILYKKLFFEIIPSNFQPDITPEWFEEVKVPLFITFDKEPIYEGDDYYFLAQTIRGWIYISMKDASKSKLSGEVKGYLYFKNLENAKTQIDILNTPKEPILEVLFYTSDNFPIRKGEPYYFIIHTFDDDYIPMKDFANCPDSGKHPEKYTYFKDVKKAIEFVEMKRMLRDNSTNTPIFSLEEVIHTDGINLSDNNKQKFIKLAKQKQSI